MYFRQLQRKIIQRLGRDLVQSVISFVRARSPKLWGEDQPPWYLEAYVLVTILKDLEGVGKDRLASEFRRSSLGFRVNHKTLLHNIEVLRPILADWASGQIKLGNWRQWDLAAQRVKKGPSLGGEFLLFGKRLNPRIFMCPLSLSLSDFVNQEIQQI